ncbi:THAP domain-containing protein 3-like isoform X4 [Periplaneta americana]|uniref:THAP domain-containing protein 3-like isoform X4 n=1 Tax=Periplaneta americana TaxID=6978 RepID=UPI0037E841B7
MVTSCIAFGCNNLQDKRIKRQFHMFPFSRPEILNRWIAAIRRENWKPSPTSRICSDHFLESDYEKRPGCQLKKLRNDAIPCVFSFPPHLQRNHTYRRKLVRSEVKGMATCTTSSEVLDNGSEEQLTCEMDVIKKEPEVDPLAIQWSDETDTDEKKPLSEQVNLLDLHVAGIKTECVDHSYDLKSDFRVEGTPVPTNFVTTKCKAEEELCDLDTVKEELKLELKAEDSEILTDRLQLQNSIIRM